MEKEYIKVEKPTVSFSKNTDVLLTMDDEFWKNWIFYCLLSFYKEFDKTELRQKIENNPSRIEKTIADFIRNYLRKDIVFNGYCKFLIDREPLNEGDFEGYYDIKIQHSYWEKDNQKIAFYFECKNLKEKPQDLINKYVYYNKGNRIFDGGVYRYFNGKYAQSQDFGGMIGFVLEGNLFTIKNEILGKLQKTKFDTSSNGNFIKFIDNSIEQNDFTFDTYHYRENKEFVIHHLLFNLCQ